MVVKLGVATTETYLCNKISIGDNDLLHTASEPVAGKGDLLPGQVFEHFHDLCDQGLLSVVGGFINIPFSDAPYKIVVGGCFMWLRKFFVFSDCPNFVTSDMNRPFLRP